MPTPRQTDEGQPTPEQRRLWQTGYERGVAAVLRVLREQGYAEAGERVERALKSGGVSTHSGG